MATYIIPEDAKADALARFNDPGPDHINCAQAVVRFAVLVLGIDPDLVDVARYFGGGIAGTGEACGAITGTAISLGLRDMELAELKDAVRPQTTEHLRDLLRGFDAEFGSRRCRDLTGFDLSTQAGHEAFVQSDIRKRCTDYVSFMCDRLAPLLLDPEGTGAV